ncbi:MAG TPA: DUF1343 domain-containing protein [Bacillales bacterium]
MMLTLGNENLFNPRYRSLWQNLRIGIVTNYTGMDSLFVRTVDRLIQQGANVKKLFSAEHGFYGAGRAGESMVNEIDRKTGIEIVSLYGESKDMDPRTLDEIDVLIFEFQDIGSRFYTYISTMFRVMETVEKVGVPLLLLDRPNPLGGNVVEGGEVEDAYLSFVGNYNIPIRHGMTLGELATLYKRENDLGVDLHIVLMEDWDRSNTFPQTHLDWVPPSQNIPSFRSAQLYPGTAFIEGTNISEGRGTTMPFQWLGAPWIDGEKLADKLNGLQLPGVAFRPVLFKPTFSKHEGKLTEGIHTHITDGERLRPTELGLHLIDQVKTLYPKEFQWLPPRKDIYFIDLLWGSAQYRKDLDRGRPVEEISQEWVENAVRFKRRRQSSLLY